MAENQTDCCYLFKLMVISEPYTIIQTQIVVSSGYLTAMTDNHSQRGAKCCTRAVKVKKLYILQKTTFV